MMAVGAARRRAAALWSAIAGFGFQPIIAFFCAAALLLFAYVVEEVREGDADAADLAILLAFREPGDAARPIGPPWLVQTAIDLSALGGTAVTSLLTAAAAGFLILRRRWRQLAVLLAAIGGAAALSAALKAAFQRDRPAVSLHLVDVWSASFPSGHAMTAAAVYLTIAAMLAKTQTSRAARIYLLSLGVFMTVLVGLTRVYLGVHWPSDVIGGWCAGAAWAMAFFLFTRRTPAARPGEDENQNRLFESAAGTRPAKDHW